MTSREIPKLTYFDGQDPLEAKIAILRGPVNRRRKLNLAENKSGRRSRADLLPAFSRAQKFACTSDLWPPKNRDFGTFKVYSQKMVNFRICPKVLFIGSRVYLSAEIVFWSHFWPRKLVLGHFWKNNFWVLVSHGVEHLPSGHQK